MNRLSAIDAFSPAIARVRDLLLQRFQLKMWIKFGFIGLLGGGVVLANTGIGGMSGREPQFPHGQAPDLGGALHSLHLSQHLNLIIILVATVFAIGLVLEYLFCRFRFILFDSIVTGQPEIGRGWNKYGSQANRYFGFWLVFKLVAWAIMFFMVVVPLWRAYKSGAFNGEGSVPALLGMLASVGLGALALSIIFGVISTLVKDFVMPVMALDNYALGDAWSSVVRVVSSEPGAWAGYMGLKLLCAFGAGISLSIIFLLALIPTLIITGIPAGIVIALGAMVIKAGATAAGIMICCLGGLIIAAGFTCVFMVLSAPISVFFASYAFYFFGGRYPKLAALLWPQPTPPAPQAAGMQPAL
jgi:hypothetical protein